MGEKTLGEAENEFTLAPSYRTAANLLSVATEYWDDVMIGDDTYRSKVKLVYKWLAAAHTLGG